jgi:protein-tyrosine phosphatase
MSGRFYPARQIVPNLWIGSAADAVDVAAARRRNFRLVVNCSRDIPPGLDIPVYRIPIDDWAGESRALLKHLPRILPVVDAVLEAGHGVLVHCFAGMQRSAAVVTAYLMWKHGYTAAEAMAGVQRIKPETFTPEPTFVKALQRWERRSG